MIHDSGHGALEVVTNGGEHHRGLFIDAVVPHLRMRISACGRKRVGHTAYMKNHAAGTVASKNGQDIFNPTNGQEDEMSTVGT